MAFMTANTSTHTAQALASHRWSELNTRDFATLDPARTVAVLPLGATEQHGPHLPVSTDTSIMNGMLETVIARLPDDLEIRILPVQSVGKSNEHVHAPGTLTLTAPMSGATLALILGDPPSIVA